MNQVEENIKLLEERMSEYYKARREFNKIKNKGCAWFIISFAMIGVDVFIPVIYFLVKYLIKSKIL